MIAKIKLFLGLIHLASSSLTLIRSTNSESITCNKNLYCNEYQSLQQTPFVCKCERGTFFYSQNQMKCYKGSGLFARCSFHFKYFETSVQTISVLKAQNNGEFYAADEFLYPIETGVTCVSMTIVKVEVLNNNMEWEGIRNEFRITKALQQFYLRWIDNQNVNTVKYVGNIIKVTLECSQNSGSKISNCLLGTIEGIRVFDGENVTSHVCDKVDPTATTSKPFRSYSKPVQSITSKTTLNLITIVNTTIPTTIDEITTEKSSTLPLIIGITCFFILLIVCIILGCCVLKRRKRRFKEKNLTRDQAEDHEELYALPSGSKDIDNPSYLMGLKSNADDNANHEYAYTTPSVNNNSEDNDNSVNDKSGDVYSNVTPLSQNYYETPDQQVGLLKKNIKAGDTGYASLNSGAYDPYVKMDESVGDSKDDYVPIESF